MFHGLLSTRPWDGGIVAAVMAAVVVAWSCLGASAADAGKDASPEEYAVGTDAAAVIRRVVERAQAVGKDTNTPLAVFDKLSFYETLDSEGRVKQVKEKRYEVSVLRGMTHNRLVAVNGRRLS